MISDVCCQAKQRSVEMNATLLLLLTLKKLPKGNNHQIQSYCLRKISRLITCSTFTYFEGILYILKERKKAFYLLWINNFENHFFATRSKMMELNKDYQVLASQKWPQMWHVISPDGMMHISPPRKFAWKK